MIFTDRQIISAGELAHYLSLFLNISMTSVAMLGWPDRVAYDPWWTSNGFCIVNGGATAIPTEWLCFFSLASSAIAGFILSKNSSKTLKDENPLLTERLQSFIFANFSHGFGHAFIWLMGAGGSAIELSLRPAALANLIMLLSFWVGTLRVIVRLSTNHAAMMSIMVLTAQYLLRVPPELAFTYSQSIILLSGSLDQLRRKEDYYSENNSFLFFANALYYLPLFPLYYFEMFSCSNSLLAYLGGHTVYDLYLALAPFALHYAVLNIETKKKIC